MDLASQPSILSKPAWLDFLGSPRSHDDFTWIMSGNAQHRTPLTAVREIVLVKGDSESPPLVGHDPAFHSFMEKLQEYNQKSCGAPELTDGFVGANGLHDGFDKFRTQPGYPMNPMSTAPRDNDAFCDSLDLPSDFRSDRHRQIFDAFMHKVFGSWTPVALKNKEGSSLGAGVWLDSAKAKRQVGQMLIDNHEQIMSRFRDRDLLGLARWYKIVFLYNAGVRLQNDKPGKDREVFDWEYAMSSGKRGAVHVADKSVRYDLGRGDVVEGWNACRARLYGGGPFTANFYPQMIASGHLHALFVNYPETFHCTDIVAAAEAIPDDEELACSDATEYDRSMRTYLLRRMFVIAREYWRPDMIDWCEYLCFAGYFSRPVDRNDPVAYMLGDAFDWGFDTFRGNPSGFAWTSLIAKIMMVFDFLATCDDLMHDVLENMDDYLRHKRSIKTRNNGDDGMYIGKTAILNAYAAYRFQKGKKNPGYFVLQLEDGQIWSGYIHSKHEAHTHGRSKFTAFRRLQTAVEKMFINERSAGSVFRPEYTIGMLGHLSGDSGHPLAGVQVDNIYRAWADAGLLASHGDLYKTIERQHRARMLRDIGEWTSIDREVRDDPDKLHYKYVDSDVSPHVLKMLFASAFLPDEYGHIVKRTYNGNILASNDAFFSQQIYGT